MKPTKSSKIATPTAGHAEAARRALEAIKKDPESPENYTALAGALRMHAQSIHGRTPDAADNMLRHACAVAWEAKRRSTSALISGRTKQEVKILTAWLRTKNHLTPEAAEAMMEEIRAGYLAQALESAVAFSDVGSR